MASKEIAVSRDDSFSRDAISPTHRYTSTRTHMHKRRHTGVPTRAHTCAHIHMHTHMNTQVHTHMHRCAHTCTSSDTHVHIYTRAQLCTYAHTNTHTSARTYTNMHTGTALPKVARGGTSQNASLPFMKPHLPDLTQQHEAPHVSRAQTMVPAHQQVCFSLCRWLGLAAGNRDSDAGWSVAAKGS